MAAQRDQEVSMTDRRPTQEAAQSLASPGSACSWRELMDDRPRRAIEDALRHSICSRRWFAGKAKAIDSVRLYEAIELCPEYCLALVRVAYAEGEPESYVLILGITAESDVRRLGDDITGRILARVDAPESGTALAIHDALGDDALSRILIETIGSGQQRSGQRGTLSARAVSCGAGLSLAQGVRPITAMIGAEQSNSSIRIADRFVLKLFRKVESGPNPDCEIGALLTEKVGFQHVPSLLGIIEYCPEEDAPQALAILQAYVHNQGDAWSYTLVSLKDFFASVGTLPAGAAPDATLLPHASLLESAEEPIPQAAVDLIGPYLPRIELLGRRTAELHLALSSRGDDEDFAPESLTPEFLRALCQRASELTVETFQLLHTRLAHLNEPVRQAATQLLDSQAAVLDRLMLLSGHEIAGQRIHCHGDYHLGQVLFTGEDFIIIDFEGEPARSLAERRIKQSPLRDVAGMLRSLDYAAHVALASASGGVAGQADMLAPWASVWQSWTSAAFLRGYFLAAGQASFLPRDARDVRLLLDAYLLDKAVYELNYELNNRPDWVAIPLDAIRSLLA